MNQSTHPPIVGQHDDDDLDVAALDPRSRRVLLDFVEHTGNDKVPLYAIGSVGDRSFRVGMKASDLQTFAKFQAALANRTGIWAWHPAEEDSFNKDIWTREVAYAFERGRRAK